LFFITLLYLLLTLIVFLRVKALGTRLLALGLLTGLLTLWSGVLAGDNGASVQVRPGVEVEVGRSIVGPEAVGLLGRVALILVLGGVAVTILGRRDTLPNGPTNLEAIRDK
jgi:hypothetical protein